MGWTQDAISGYGHAIECRIYAEDPEKGFLPAAGDVTLYHEPQMRGVRIDSSIDGACIISGNYDPMIAKLICHGKTRSDAIEITKKALSNFIIQSEKSNLTYLQSVVSNTDFAENNIDTSYCNAHHDELLHAMEHARSLIKKEDVAAMFLFHDFNARLWNNSTMQDNDGVDVWNTIGYWRFQMSVNVTVDVDRDPLQFKVNIKKLSDTRLECVINGCDYSVVLTNQEGDIRKVIINGKTEPVFVSQTPSHDFSVHLRGFDFLCRRDDQLRDVNDYVKMEVSDDLRFVSPMPGNVMKVNVKEGDMVSAGTVLCIVEAMKMENNIVARCDAKVAKVNVREGNKVDTRTILIELTI